MKPFDLVPLEGSSRLRNDVMGPKLTTFAKIPVAGVMWKKGCWTDAWGCVFEAAEDGVVGEVKNALLDDWAKLDTFKPPWASLKDPALAHINATCATSEKFVMPMWCDIQPFQRMQFLRGTEMLFMDLAYGESEVYRLRDMVHEFYLKKVEILCQTDVDGIHVEDDWGSQQALLVSPALWRAFFKPLYKDYCDLARKHGKKLVLHSDGHIMAILPDLVEIGVDAVNAQIDCMDLDAISANFHGKIAFWGGFDRQRLLPFGTDAEIRQEVRRIAKSFFQYGRTGIIGQCFLDKGTPDAALDAVYDEWMEL
jgi:hypothetical protein